MTLSKGTLFNEQIVSDLINKVKGRSSLAVLANQEPIPFNGQKEFTFELDQDIDIVAENGAKGHGGATLAPVTIVPIKVEYGARISDEFMFAAEEEQINILKAFNDGFAKKLARGFDLMAMHGVNPRSKSASAIIGNNAFDKAVTQTVIFNESDPESNIEAAVLAIQGSDGDVTGMAMSPVFSSALAQLKYNGVRQYPEFGWGANPGAVNGLKVDVNKTVSEGETHFDRAILGDFENMFKWGYAKTIPTKLIEYGDPDNTGKDLQGYNQVYLRAEAYIGWGVMDAGSFARVIVGDTAGTLAIVLKDGAVSGTATDTITPAKGASNSYLYKVNAEVPTAGTILVAGTDGWAAYTAGADIVTTAGNTIVLAEVVTSTGAVVNVGEVEVETADIAS